MQTFIKLTADFSTESLHARKQWDDIFEKNKTVSLEYYTSATVIQKMEEKSRISKINN